MRIFVDIDGTLCDYEIGRPYEESQPYPDMIELVNHLFDSGHHIVIWTARGCSTGVDYTELTKKQLKEWGVQYNELRLDKPGYDLFIDDRTVNAVTIKEFLKVLG